MVRLDLGLDPGRGANCREVVDNVVDMAHFFYIHFAFPTYFRNVFEGHIASQYLQDPVPAGRRPGNGQTSNYSDGATRSGCVPRPRTTVPPT